MIHRRKVCIKEAHDEQKTKNITNYLKSSQQNLFGVCGSCSDHFISVPGGDGCTAAEI